MQPYDCRDMVLCLDETSEGFEIRELMIGKVVGAADVQYRAIWLKAEIFLHLPLELPLFVRRRGESEKLIEFKAIRITPHPGQRSMDVLGEERIEAGASPVLADASF